MRAASSERGSPEAATMRSVSGAGAIPPPEGGGGGGPAGGPAGRAAAPEPLEGQKADERVAADDRPPLVHGQAAVRVAVERETQVGARRADPGGQSPRRGGAA